MGLKRVRHNWTTKHEHTYTIYLYIYIKSQFIPSPYPFFMLLWPQIETFPKSMCHNISIYKKPFSFFLTTIIYRNVNTTLIMSMLFILGWFFTASSLFLHFSFPILSVATLGISSSLSFTSLILSLAASNWCFNLNYCHFIYIRLTLLS